MRPYLIIRRFHLVRAMMTIFIFSILTSIYKFDNLDWPNLVTLLNPDLPLFGLDSIIWRSFLSGTEVLATSMIMIGRSGKYCLKGGFN